MNLKDTESRLRDYLSDKARAVPDDTAPPGVVTNGHRRTWPALAAAAAVLAISVPLLIRIDGQPQPAASGAPLAVPYVVGNTLFDGDAKVPGPRGTMRILARYTDGWLVLTHPAKPEGPVKTQIGILSRSGKFVQRGPDNPQHATASPDRTKMVVVAPDKASGTTVLRVIDLKSGRELSSRKAFPGTALHGWNGHGVWYSSKSTNRDMAMYVWQPDKSEPRRVPVADFAHGATALGTTDRMVVATQPNPNRSCVQVVELRYTGRFETLRQHCRRDGKAMYPVLSPDGASVTLPQERITIEVNTGRVGKLRGLPDNKFLMGFLDVYENPSSVLIVELISGPAGKQLENPSGRPSSRGTRPANDAVAVHRCDIKSDSCKVVLDSPDWVSLSRP